jgi:transmembrane sensor
VATTGVGESLTIRLADSSLVTMGPVSTIRYSTSATGRSVALVDGIADFSVVHDVTRPFRVRAKNALVTDIGTEFVVRAYAADSGVDVSVNSGIARVSGGASDSVELRAGQVAVVTANSRVAKRTDTSAQTLMGLVHGRLVFDDVPLSTVAAELGRWLDVQIRIPDRQLAQLRLSARYNHGQTLSSVLDAITATHPVRYQRSGNVVTLRPAKP